LVQSVDDLDMDLVDNVLVTHPSGLKVLLGPARIEQAELIHADKVAALVEKLKGEFDFIVIDLSTRLDELALALFDLAERIVLVANPTLPCVKNTLVVMNLMDELGYPEVKTQLVINRVTPELEKSKITLAVQAIEGKLRRKALGVIPMDERRVLFAVNRGTSVVAKDQNVSPAKELIALAEALRANVIPQEQLQDQPTTTPSKTSLFGRLKST
jgi:pilus assembly protein CpaE